LKKGAIFFKPSQGGIYYAEARDTTTNCKGTVRVPSYAFVNPLPSYKLEAQKPTCVDYVAQTDGKIRINNLKNGSKYDVTIGNTYTGNKTYDTAKEIPADSILLNQVVNPSISQSYTVRIFGEPHCFTDQTITFTKTDCGCRTPSFGVVVTRGSCNGTEVLSDAKITLVDIKNGKRYGQNKGKIYTGTKTYSTASAIPTDGVILRDLANPSVMEYYTVRVMDSTGCFTDSVLVFEPRICECPRPPFVVPESQAVCVGDTLRTVKGFVDSGVTVDWYDSPTGGTLLQKGTIFFKPSQGGIYYAEARDTTTNCKGTVRVPSYAFVNPLPSFNLEAWKPTCVQNTAQNDAIIKIKNLKNGTRFDFSLGDKYIGGRTFDNAFEIPSDSILAKNISNPASSQKYTIRLFSEHNCSTDQTISITRFDCNCLPININVLAPSRVCAGETLPMLTAIVPQNVTVDWYDAPIGGGLLKPNSIYYQPTQIGTYYAEGKSLILSGCVSPQRIAVKIELAIKPSFALTTVPATCLGDTSKADAQLLIENLKEGDKFDYSIGSIYIGTANYENAKLVPQGGVIAANLSNVTQFYTIRLFNRCGLFEDKITQLVKNDCKCSPPKCFPLQMKKKRYK